VEGRWSDVFRVVFVVAFCTVRVVYRPSRRQMRLPYPLLVSTPLSSTSNLDAALELTESLDASQELTIRFNRSVMHTLMGNDPSALEDLNTLLAQPMHETNPMVKLLLFSLLSSKQLFISSGLNN